MIYLCTFCLSSLFFKIAESQNRTIKFIFNFLALLLPILLATLRNYTVGIDVSTYVKPATLIASTSRSVKSYFTLLSFYPNTMDLDVGFSLIVYLSQKIFKSLQGVFLINSLFTILPIYFFLNNINKYLEENKYYDFKVPIWSSFFFYYCIFYNNSLNQVRQSITCSLSLLIFSFFLRKKYLKMVLTFLLAISIHKSSIIIIAIIFLWKLTSIKDKNIKRLLFCLIILFLIQGNKVLSGILMILGKLNILGARYTNGLNSGNLNINFSWVIISILMLIITAYIYFMKERNKLNTFMLLISILSLGLQPFAAMFDNLGRSLIYLLMFAILILPAVCKIIHRKIVQSGFLSLAYTLIGGLSIWIVTVGLFDYTGTLNYTFFF